MITVITGCLPRVITRGAGMSGVSHSYVTQDAIPRVRAPPRYRVVPTVDLIKKP
jgi:hypothetical protein